MAFKAALTDLSQTALSDALERAMFRGELGHVLRFKM